MASAKPHGCTGIFNLNDAQTGSRIACTRNLWHARLPRELVWEEGKALFLVRLRCVWMQAVYSFPSTLTAGEVHKDCDMAIC
jgi:hypothetical protein